jgi:hypothetical protein
MLFASQEVGLEVRGQKIKSMFMSRHQNSGKNHYNKIIWKCDKVQIFCNDE